MSQEAPGSPDVSLSSPAAGPGRHGLTYPCETPGDGHSLPVAEGVRWIRMPMPGSLKYINLWAIQDDSPGQPGWTLVDTGLQLPDTAAAWRRVLAEDLAPGTPRRIIATHMHPD
ncbi:MAG: MBL fold metallo-hydrolase, partial [Burkholderiales bacterium]